MGFLVGTSFIQGHNAVAPELQCDFFDIQGFRMTKNKLVPVVSCLVSGVFSLPSGAETEATSLTTCSSSASSREISVVYKSWPDLVPCEVRYFKHGNTTTLWSAVHKTGYCEEKSLGLVNQLQQLGYICHTLNSFDDSRKIQQSEPE